MTTLEDPVFAEDLVAGRHTFSGIFVLDGSGLIPETVCADLKMCYDSIRQHRIRRWPRGIARYILVPVYCASGFQEATRRFLFSYGRPRRFCVLLKPVLYDSADNRVVAKDAVQNDTLSWYPHLKGLFVAGISKAVAHFGNDPALTTDAYAELVLKLKLRRQTTSPP